MSDRAGEDGGRVMSDDIEDIEKRLVGGIEALRLRRKRNSLIEDALTEIRRLRAIPQMVANRIVDRETHHEALRQYVGDGLDESTVEVLLAWLDNLVRRVADEIDRESGYEWKPIERPSWQSVLCHYCGRSRCRCPTKCRRCGKLTGPPAYLSASHSNEMCDCKQGAL